MTHLKRLMSLVIFGFLATACSSSTVKNSWVKPGYTDKTENIYIIAITKENDYRRIFEETLQRKLSTLGVQAVASFIDLPQDQENKETIIKAMKANGCDSVLLTKLVKKRIAPGTKGQAIKIVPAAPGLYYDPWYNRWGTYYDMSSSVINIQPTTPGTTTLVIESVLFDLKTEERIWAAQLETVEEINPIKMIRDYVESVSRNLKGKGLI